MLDNSKILNNSKQLKSSNENKLTSKEFLFKGKKNQQETRGGVTTTPFLTPTKITPSPGGAFPVGVVLHVRLALLFCPGMPLVCESFHHVRAFAIWLVTGRPGAAIPLAAWAIGFLIPPLP